MSKSVECIGGDFCEEVQGRSGTLVSVCLQCHKCSTGCPIGPEMDLLSSQVMRLVQLGMADEVLSSRAIWLCASCETCTTRCPMEHRRGGRDGQPADHGHRASNHAAGPAREQFNRSFLGSVRRHGRVYELGMMTAYKLRSGDLMSDVGKVPQMLAKGKLSLLPNRSGAAGEVREIFRRAEEEDRKS